MKLYLTEVEGSANLPRREREEAAVSRLVREAFGDLAIKENLPYGAPVISVKGEVVDVPVSISHCSAIAALVVGQDGRSIGVDVEIYREQLRRVKHKFLTPEESAVYTTDNTLLAAWTLKEATYKAALTPGLALTDIRLPLVDGCRQINVKGKVFAIERCGFIARTKVWLSVVKTAGY